MSFDSALAIALEQHETQSWAATVEAAAGLLGNPLGAVVERSGPVPWNALTVFDSGNFNRVIGLGCSGVADRESVGALVDFYRRLGQTRYRVELAG